ncbi:MAG: NAD(P)/FAD-dependent oxidoreductase [Oscillospiraceae bacterium]
MQDVIIIGGGIVGCSLLYRLSFYNVKVTLLEKENDIAMGTTKANSAIVHAGYDPEPGTKMARYNVQGNAMIQELCKNLDIPYKQTGSLVVGFTDADRAQLQELYARGQTNGVPGLKIVEQEELCGMEPAISPEATCALYAPTGGIVNPWELALAQAEVAVQNGAQVCLNSPVQKIEKTNDGFAVYTDTEVFFTRFVVNAAGIHTADICNMVEKSSYTIWPNKGQYFLLDTTQGNLVKHVVFQCPTPEGKGVLVSPTVHGNLIVGPNTGNSMPDDTSTTEEGLCYIKASAMRAVQGIEFRENIRNFAGLRAVANADDFIVEESAKTPGFFQAAGIKSPGLTAAPAIAADLENMLQQAGLFLIPKKGTTNMRRVVRFKYLSAEEKKKLVCKNPLYGTVICRCETVTEGEIVEALHRTIPPVSLDGIKRRCTPGMGRCQGGFCGPRVQAIIARESGIQQEEITQDGRGTTIIYGKTKREEAGV